MKIVAINGSHQGAKGYTHFLVEKLFKGARDNQTDCEEIFLSKLKIHACKACQICQTEKHFLKCVYDKKDDVTSIFKKMQQADIIIYATPVYIMNMTGLMKIFLDRMFSTGNISDVKLSNSGLFFHHINKVIYSKPFATLICQDNFENETTKNIVSYFKTFSKFFDAPQVGTIVRRSGQLTGHGKNPNKEQQFPKILDSYQAIENAGKELSIYGKISNKTQKRASQDIQPVPFFSALKNLKGFKKKAVQIMKSGRY